MLKKKTPLCFIGFLFLSICVSSSARKLTEQELKVVFLERFTRFIDWPESSRYSLRKEFKIGVLGMTSLVNDLKKTYQNRRIKNKKVIIEIIKTNSDIKDIDILFISQSKRNDLRKIIAKTTPQSILTISDSIGFCQRGVIINFYKEAKRLRFEINEAAARQANFTISYQLLRSAKIIDPLRK